MDKGKKKITPKKTRENKYEEKLKVNITFDELMNLTVKGNPKPKKKDDK